VNMYFQYRAGMKFGTKPVLEGESWARLVSDWASFKLQEYWADMSDWLTIDVNVNRFHCPQSQGS